MPLPPQLTNAIDELLAGIPPAVLAGAVAELTAAYLPGRRSRPSLNDVHRAAYVLARMPATYAVISRVLCECKLRIPELRVESLLDLGSGPGTVLWAAAEHFPELERIVAVEDSAKWVDIGKRLAIEADHVCLRSADWRQRSVTDELPAGGFDLVTVSYLMNELPASERSTVIRKAWQRARNLFVIIEPGTPEGFSHVLELRRSMIATGAHVVAPCAHAGQCPMSGGDWCHFGARLQRTAHHRAAKKANLGYEDEKFSYVVFAREAVPLPSARILRHPQKHSGHVLFELCTTDGLKRESVSRRHGERYKSARKAEWGDILRE